MAVAEKGANNAPFGEVEDGLKERNGGEDSPLELGDDMVGHDDDVMLVEPVGEEPNMVDDDAAFFGGKGMPAGGKGKGMGKGKGKGPPVDMPEPEDADCNDIEEEQEEQEEEEEEEEEEAEEEEPTMESTMEATIMGGQPIMEEEPGMEEEPAMPGIGTMTVQTTGLHEGGGKGIQPFSPEAPFSPPEEGLLSAGSAAIHFDEQIRAMHNKVDNVMTERCRCRTRPCKCKHTSIAGFTRDGDKKGARAARNKLPDPDTEVNRLHISFRDLDKTNPDDLGRGKRATKRKYDDGEADFVLDDNGSLPMLPPKRRNTDSQFGRSERDARRGGAVRQRHAEFVSPSEHRSRPRPSGIEIPATSPQLTHASPSDIPPPRGSPGLGPRGSPGLGPQRSPRERTKKEEPLINEQVIIQDGKNAGQLGIVRDSSHGFYAVQIFGEEEMLSAMDVRAPGGEFVLGSMVTVVSGELAGQPCMLMSIEGDEVTVAVVLGKANLRRTQFQPVKPELQRIAPPHERSRGGSHRSSRDSGHDSGARPRRNTSQQPGAYAHLASDEMLQGSVAVANGHSGRFPSHRLNGHGLNGGGNYGNGVHGMVNGGSSKIAQMISRARMKCASLRSMLQQAREMGLDSEMSASEEEGMVDMRTAAGHARRDTGPICGDLAPVHEGGIKCWRRVRVYNEGTDRWEMAVLCEEATDSRRVRVTYTQGGSDWIDLGRKSVLEQGQVVWAKMGRKYPWWPAQVLLEIGLKPPGCKANEVTVEWLGENTVAQVNSTSVLPFEAHFQEHRAAISSGKKIFGFQRNLVRPALEEARQRLRDREYHNQLVAQQKSQMANGKREKLTNGTHKPIINGAPNGKQHNGDSSALMSMHNALAKSVPSVPS